MNELQKILTVYQHARSRQRLALATVVKTSGSVYRRPGARMILTETGQTVGAISGGCLESDVRERTQSVMGQDKPPIVVQYDTTASEDVIWGLGMGCQGVVHVLIESLATETAQSLLEFIAECFQQNQPGAIATLFQVEGDVQATVGDRAFLKSDGTLLSPIRDRACVDRLLPDIQRVLAEGTTQVVSYESGNGRVEALIETVQPPTPLLVFGAGYDAIPVVQFAKQLGWHVTVVDHRPAIATRDRFPLADSLLMCQPPHLSEHLALNSRMVAVVMTHHYLHDRALLQTLLPSPVRYVGVLGPKRRTEQLLHDLRAEGLRLTESQLNRLHAPIGLDIGSETPEEIALAIVAEIQAFLKQRPGTALRSRQGGIHQSDANHSDLRQPCLTLA